MPKTPPNHLGFRVYRNNPEDNGGSATPGLLARLKLHNKPITMKEQVLEWGCTPLPLWQTVHRWRLPAIYPEIPKPEPFPAMNLEGKPNQLESLWGSKLFRAAPHTVLDIPDQDATPPITSPVSQPKKCAREEHMELWPMQACLQA